MFAQIFLIPYDFTHQTSSTYSSPPKDRKGQKYIFIYVLVNNDIKL